jgi:hypothetical protein
MRDLPPLPPDFVVITATWSVRTSFVTTSWHLFAPGADDATTVELNALLGQFFLFPVADLLSVLSSDTSCSLLRLATVGTAPFVVEYVPAFNTGAIGEASSLNSAAVLTWRTSQRRIGGHFHTWLPLALPFVADDRRHVTDLAYSELAGAARSFALHVNEIPSPDGGLCVLAAVSRSEAGVPLPTSTWTPVLLGDASRTIGTLRRRI